MGAGTGWEITKEEVILKSVHPSYVRHFDNSMSIKISIFLTHKVKFVMVVVLLYSLFYAEHQMVANAQFKAVPGVQ